MTHIHPTALVSSTAILGEGVSIGPFCIVEDGVELGEGCQLHARVSLKAGTVLGPHNQVFEGAVLGQAPQHRRAGEHVGGLRIGRGNVIRENVTVHRAMHADQFTVLGDENMLMVGAHVAHDCVVGHHTILANNVMLAGHVIVHDRAFLSGAVGVHQFCRVGANAMVGGQCRVVRDVPPFVTVDGVSNCVVGINSIGLRRAGYTSSQLKEIKAAYRLIYRSDLTWNDKLAALRATFLSGPASTFADFFATCQRGIVGERRRMMSTLRLADIQAAHGDAAGDRLAS